MLGHFHPQLFDLARNSRAITGGVVEALRVFGLVLSEMPSASKEFERKLGVLCLQRRRLGRSSRATTAEDDNLGLGGFKLR